MQQLASARLSLEAARVSGGAARAPRPSRRRGCRRTCPAAGVVESWRRQGAPAAYLRMPRSAWGRSTAAARSPGSCSHEPRRSRRRPHRGRARRVHDRRFLCSVAPFFQAGVDVVLVGIDAGTFRDAGLEERSDGRLLPLASILTAASPPRRRDPGSAASPWPAYRARAPLSRRRRRSAPFGDGGRFPCARPRRRPHRSPLPPAAIPAGSWRPGRAELLGHELYIGLAQVQLVGDLRLERFGPMNTRHSTRTRSG